MKHIVSIFFLLSITFTQSGFAQSHTFTIEDVQEGKLYEGKYKQSSAEDKNFRLIRVDNSDFSKKEFKRFKQLKNNYLVSLNSNKTRARAKEQIVVGKKVYSKIKENKNTVIYETLNNRKNFVQEIEISYNNNQLEKATFKQYHPQSNQERNLYIIRFFSYN